MGIPGKKWDEDKFCTVKGEEVSVQFIKHKSINVPLISCNEYQCKQYDCCYCRKHIDKCTKEYLKL